MTPRTKEHIPSITLEVNQIQRIDPSRVAFHLKVKADRAEGQEEPMGGCQFRVTTRKGITIEETFTDDKGEYGQSHILDVARGFQERLLLTLEGSNRIIAEVRIPSDQQVSQEKREILQEEQRRRDEVERIRKAEEERVAAERRTREREEQRRRDEAERIRKAEEERVTAERRAREEAEQRSRDEVERILKAEEERIAAERKAEEEAEQRIRKEAERIRKAEEARVAAQLRAEAEKLEREQAAKRAIEHFRAVLEGREPTLRDEVVSLEASTYPIPGIIQVRDGGALKITPGATLRFLPKGGISVTGSSLFAEGLPDQPIRFESANSQGEEEKDVHWMGIKITRNPGGRTPMMKMQHCIVDGGTVSLEGVSAGEILDSVISHGKNARGGGVYIANSHRIGINRSTICNNEAEEGGGIYVEHSSVEILRSKIMENQASIGGGILISDEERLEKIKGMGRKYYINRAYEWAIRKFVGLEVSVKRLNNNDDEFKLPSEEWTTLDGLQVSGNSAKEAGGGLSIRKGAHAKVNNTEFRDNTAGDRAATIDLEGEEIVFSFQSVSIRSSNKPDQDVPYDGPSCNLDGINFQSGPPLKNEVLRLPFRQATYLKVINAIFVPLEFAKIFGKVSVGLLKIILLAFIDIMPAFIKDVKNIFSRDDDNI